MYFYSDNSICTKYKTKTIRGVKIKMKISGIRSLLRFMHTEDVGKFSTEYAVMILFTKQKQLR